jgi:DNA-binding transcriptional ArsR family regulator
MSRTLTAAASRLARSAPVFAALGDETRLDIVARLCTGGPQSIVRLTEGSSVSRQAITKHLHALAEAGLVQSTRRGRERIWAIRAKRLADARRYLEQISARWDEALERLRAEVETEDER